MGNLGWRLLVCFYRDFSDGKIIGVRRRWCCGRRRFAEAARSLPPAAFSSCACETVAASFAGQGRGAIKVR